MIKFTTRHKCNDITELLDIILTFPDESRNKLHQFYSDLLENGVIVDLEFKHTETEFSSIITLRDKEALITFLSQLNNIKDNYVGFMHEKFNGVIIERQTSIIQ